MTGGIYKIVNLNNGKCYVGSAKDFNTRRDKHFKLLNDNKHFNIKLQRSYNKYGPNAFSFEIIEPFEYNKAKLRDRENFWIKQLNSKINGYNIADANGGDCLSYHPLKDQIVAKMSKTQKDRNSKLSRNERIQLFGGENNGMYGKNHSEESKAKIRLKAIGRKVSDETKLNIRKNNPKSTKISVDGITYMSIREASTKLKIDKNKLKRHALNDKYPNVYLVLI